MRIESIETARLGGATGCVRIDTDEGISGYGEATPEQSPEAVFKYIDRFADEYLIGQDPIPIEKHRRVLQDAVWYYEGVVPSSAITAVEHALWDIKGKSLGVPVYELLGGPVREKVRVYKWIGAETRSNLPKQAKQRVEEGLTGIKFCPTPDDPSAYPQVVEEVRETVREVREAVGPDIDIMLDPAQRFKLAEAKHILAELEEFNPLFAEDFVSPYEVSVVEKLADSTHIPYALGDRLFFMEGFDEIIHRNAAAVLQPDIAHCGGLGQLKSIAAAAEARGIRVAPHNAVGPIATAAAVHIDLSIPNFLIQEMAGTDYFGGWQLEEYLNIDILEIEDGYIPAPEKPGLGVSVDDEVFEDDFDVGYESSPLFVDPEDFHVPQRFMSWDRYDGDMY